MAELQLWQWALIAAGAFLIGLSKTGIAGIGIFTVAVFALVFPAQASTGVVLPLLICADVVAVTAYRRHAVWRHLWRLMPWAAAGIVVGWAAMGRIDSQQVSKLIGFILAAMVVLHLWRKHKTQHQPDDADDIPQSLWFVATMGLLAGFTTMVANAAGPIMIMYLLAMRLPKMEFFGTGAWYFLILNCFKVPFSQQLGLITLSSLSIDLMLAPFAVGGAFFGRYLLPYINQKLFENLALFFTVAAAIKLLL